MSIIRLAQKLFCRVSNAKNIVIEYEDLKNGKDLTQVIEQAYGPTGLGILFVNGIPDYAISRIETLPSIWQLGNLPQQTLRKYQRPDIFHSLGWSKGVEQYEGQYDEAKGSYYVNCTTDALAFISEQQYKFYSKQKQQMLINDGGNIWINELPHIEQNIKFLSSLMIKTGALLAQQIDAAAIKKVKGYQRDHLTRIINEGYQHIGRMLHYFPFKQKGKTQGDWCGWHNDHSALTALTSAMYIGQNGKEVDIKQIGGGLYAKNRFAQMARISIPENMLAFQLGQVSQIITGGYLQATPHCVVRSNEIAGKNISRDTFALFMQPNPLQSLSVPDSVKQSDITMNPAYNIPQLRNRWNNGMLFKDFHNATIKHYS